MPSEMVSSGGIVLKMVSSALLSLLVGCLAITTTALGSIVINELEVNPSQSGNNWVELYNTGNSSADISGWYVTISDQGWVGKISIPAGSIITAGGFYVANGNPQWSHNGGGSVDLYNGSGEKMDSTPYLEDRLGNDFTWGRHPDGHNTNTDGDFGWSMATKGKPNTI
jgi:hypothetical protein